jgi:uncharacterized protein (TIGR02145 family)
MLKMKKSKSNKSQKERGSALVLAIVVLVNALFIVVAISSIAVVEYQMSAKNRSSISSFQSADSGVEYVLGMLKKDSSQTIASLCQSFSSTTGKCVIDPSEVGSLSIGIYFLDETGNVIKDGDVILSGADSIRSVGDSGESGFETTRAVEVSLDAFSCGNSIEYEGEIYPTVLIEGEGYSQCWLKENLNVGNMISGVDDQGTDCNNIQKYCYNNAESNCDDYGGLYQWDQAMCGKTTEGAQGICPDGWHIPTDEEWKILEGMVDSTYEVGAGLWDNVDWRGNDAGTNLKTGDFSALLAGYRRFGGLFRDGNLYSYFWSSSLDATNIWGRKLSSIEGRSYRYAYDNPSGFSVRCIKD